MLDNFDDAEFSSSPPWMGDTADFLVNSSLQLQLNAGAAGNSYLSTPSTPNMFSELEWRFFINLSFSPSSGNYAKVYLVSDQVDLRGPLNGYYLQFGESLSNDAVELFRQDGTSSVSVCRATDAAIATAFSISVKVTRDQIGLWSLWIDYGGGSNYVLETYGAEAMYTSSAFFGVFCDYTTGNRNNFYFDDFYVGPLIHDTIAPVLNSLQIQSSSTLLLHFSEALDPPTANTVNNYFVDGGIGNPISATIDASDPKLVLLNFSSPFLSAFQHLISCSNVKDLAGNTILAGSGLTFTYYPPVVVAPFDIIFTEIMFEPSSSSALPNFEYVEIYNRNQEAISLKDWSLTDGSTTGAFPELIILPQSYVILCNTSAAPFFATYGTTLGLNSFPVLNNDVGDHLQLRDENSNLVEELTFSNQTYRDGSKDDGGYSLERIDKSFLCTDPLNWRASVSPLGGTPGMPSSVAGTYQDIEKPVLLRASLQDSVHLLIVFSEKMDPANILDPSRYSIFETTLSAVHPDSVETTDDPLSYLLRLPFIADQRIFELSVEFGLKDCPGNDLDISQSIKFSFPQKVEVGDVIINEILFNPQSEGSDFVELYNRSQKVLDIFHWRMAEAPFDDISSAQSSKSISEKQQLFFPGEYISLSANAADIRQRYSNPGIKPFLNVNDFPDFNSTDGAVVLYDSMGNILDQFSYSEDMHFPLLIDKKGVSLERLSSEMNSNEKDNWHSASSSSGFATPAYKNSLGWNASESSAELSVEPSVFSPDNDGFNDLLFINLKQNGKEGIAKVLVFDMKGSVIRELAQQKIIGDEDVLIWDGLNAKGELAGIGIYVIYAEFFHADGNVKRNKIACALTLK